MELRVLSWLLEMADGVLTGVCRSADRKTFMRGVHRHFAKEYKKNFCPDEIKYKEIELIHSVIRLDAKRLYIAPVVTEEIRAQAGDIALGITWQIVENDMGLLGLQRPIRAVGTLIGLNKDSLTPLFKQIISEGHLETLKDLSNGKSIDAPRFNSLKRALKKIIDIYDPNWKIDPDLKIWV